MPSYQDRIYEIAEDQHGYFSRHQALELGVTDAALIKMAARGTAERVARGVYRLTRFPPSPYGEYMAAVLWPRAGVTGVISHQSALVLHEISDASPSKVHITLPTTYRVRRDSPRQLSLHHAALSPEDVGTIHGLPVTVPVRTIVDVATANAGPAIVRQAIEDGERLGRLTRGQAEQLRTTLLAVSTGHSDVVSEWG